LSDSSEIKGTEFLFPQRIHETHFDTTSGFVTVQLRGLYQNRLELPGIIVQYDLKNKRQVWNKSMDYGLARLNQKNGFMIYATEVKSARWNIYLGHNMWEVRNDIHFVDPLKNIGLGYRIRGSTSYSDELQGINMNNGKILWERKIFKAFGWNDLFYTNDSTLIIVSGGIHSLNILTGQGWDYHAMTGSYDYKGKKSPNPAGIEDAFRSETLMMSTGYTVIRDLVSNALVDSTHIYLASQEELVKLDIQSGNISWKSPLPENLASKSYIFKNDSVVFMVNQGIAYWQYRQLFFGKPFFAAFDMFSGTQKFLSLIDVNDDPILTYTIKNDEIFLLSKKRIAKYSMVSGAMLDEMEIDQNIFGELSYFVGNKVYITGQGGKFENLTLSDSTMMYVFTDKQKTLSIDNELNINGIIPFEDLNNLYLTTDQFKFLARGKGKSTIVLNHAGEKVAEINVSAKAELIDNCLYEARDNILIKIDLNEIEENR
jgi:outer membrane protein assembly factor BamB